MTRLAVLLLISAPLLSSATNPPAAATVRGMVVNAKTHEPLKRAALFLVDRLALGRRLGCLTDPNGQFAFASIPPGSYRLEASKEGYNGTGQVLELAPGQEIKDLIYNLNPAAILTGRVLDDLGDPAAGAQVHVLHAMYGNRAPQLMPVNMQLTNDRGEFRVAGLAHGTYYVKATYRDPLQRSGAFKTADQDYGYPVMFYPGVPDVSQAAPVEVNDGDERGGIEIRLQRTRTFAVMGAVLNSITNQPAVQVSVSLYAKSAGGYAAPDVIASAQTDASGRFFFSDIAAGTYGVAASGAMPDGSVLSARARFDVSESQVSSIGLALRRGSPVKGVIQLDNSGTLESPAAAQKAGWMSNLALFLRPIGDNPRTSSSTLRARIQPNGAFEVNDVPDDTYGIAFIYLPDDYYVKSARASNQDALHTGFTTQEGMAEPLSIVLSSGGGRIDGVVANNKGEAVPGAHVVVASDTTPPTFSRHAAADQNGRFSLRGLVPGAYQLIAVENPEEGEYYAPVFLTRHARNSKKVTVEEKGRYSMSLELTAPE